jgi:hypothetical protein
MPGSRGQAFFAYPVGPAEFLLCLRLLAVASEIAVDVLPLLGFAEGFLQQTAEERAAALLSLDQFSLDRLEEI